MKIKKLVASFLTLSFMSMFTTPLSAGVVAKSSQMTLSEFLKTTDKVEASYSYPSMKLTSNGAGKSTLKAHTPVVIRAVDTITTGEIVSGGTVNFSVVSDVKDVNGNILVKSGAPVTAQISFTKSKGMIGRSGEVTVSDFSTIAVDGSYIPLSGSVSARPNDKMTMSIVLSVLICPLFLLMKGQEAVVPAGTQKTAYTVNDVYIKPNDI